MRTLLVLAIGLAGSFGVVYLTKVLGKGTVTGAITFLGLWLVFCIFDYMAGVRAGYSPLEELGIHLVLFTIPAFGGWFAARLLS